MQKHKERKAEQMVQLSQNVNPTQLDTFKLELLTRLENELAIFRRRNLENKVMIFHECFNMALGIR